MEKSINKIILSIIGILLTIIGWFCAQTYQKIIDLNITMTEIKIELTKLQTQSENYVTKIEMREYVDNKIK